MDRRRTDSEEVLVSALLTPVQFVDCRTSLVGEGGAADYAVNAVQYHSFPGDAGEDKYEGPSFSNTKFLWSITPECGYEHMTQSGNCKVVNGLLQREDWETAIKLPLGIIPAAFKNISSFGAESCP